MIYVGIVCGIFLLDFFIKKYIEEKKELYEEEKIFNGKIILRKYHNQGALLNFLEKKPFVVVVISSIAIVSLVITFGMSLFKKENELMKLGLSFTLGGALSNLYDRLIRKYVVDYFSFNSKWKKLKKVIFNVSDLCIFLGGFLIIIASMFNWDN